MYKSLEFGQSILVTVVACLFLLLQIAQDNGTVKQPKSHRCGLFITKLKVPWVSLLPLPHKPGNTQFSRIRTRSSMETRFLDTQLLIFARSQVWEVDSIKSATFVHWQFGGGGEKTSASGKRGIQLSFQNSVAFPFPTFQEGDLFHQEKTAPNTRRGRPSTSIHSWTIRKMETLKDFNPERIWTLNKSLQNCFARRAELKSAKTWG